MSRGSLALLIACGGLVLLALRGAVAYDFHSYEVIGGFAASCGTWLLVAAGMLLAIVALWRRRLHAAAVAANAFAATCIACAIAITVRTTPHRVDPPHEERDCSNQNIQIGCQLHAALDALEVGPPPAAPSRALLIAALATYGLVGASLVIRGLQLAARPARSS